jgi:hypothetical protein
MPDADIHGAPSAPVEKPVEKPVQAYHFANLGLNRKVARASNHEVTAPRRTTADDLDVGRSVVFRPRYSEDLEEDLAEMEELMVPEDMRSSCSNNRNTLADLSSQPLKEINTSKCTAGILTTSDWQPIESPLAEATVATSLQQEVPAILISEIIAEEIPEEEGSVIDLTSDREGDEEVQAEPEEDASKTYLDEKHFGHYGYRNYLHPKEPKPDEVPKSTKRDIQTKLKVNTKSGAQLTLKIISPLDAIAPKPKTVAIAPKPRTVRRPPTPIVSRSNTNTPGSTSSTSSFHKASPTTTKPNLLDDSGLWELISGNADSPRTGNKTPDKLHIRIWHIITGQNVKFSFKGMPHEDINWNNRSHIQQIINWRTTIFLQRHFNTKKAHVNYSPVEDAWLMLHHRKIRGAIEAGHELKTPGPTLIVEAFNAFFRGKVFTDEAGDVVTVPVREYESIRGKFGQRKGELANYRRVTSKLMEGRKGGMLYMPIITREDLEAFQDHGTVVVDDPRDASKNAVVESGKSRKASPKRKREEGDGGEMDVKRAKQEDSGVVARRYDEVVRRCPR